MRTHIDSHRVIPTSFTRHDTAMEVLQDLGVDLSFPESMDGHPHQSLADILSTFDGQTSVEAMDVMQEGDAMDEDAGEEMRFVEQENGWFPYRDRDEYFQARLLDLCESLSVVVKRSICRLLKAWISSNLCGYDTLIRVRHEFVPFRELTSMQQRQQKLQDLSVDLFGTQTFQSRGERIRYRSLSGIVKSMFLNPMFAGQFDSSRIMDDPAFSSSEIGRHLADLGSTGAQVVPFVAHFDGSHLGRTSSAPSVDSVLLSPIMKSVRASLSTSMVYHLLSSELGDSETILRTLMEEFEKMEALTVFDAVKKRHRRVLPVLVSIAVDYPAGSKSLCQTGATGLHFCRLCITPSHSLEDLAVHGSTLLTKKC